MHRDRIFSMCYNIGKLILLFYGAILYSCLKTPIAVSGDSCSFCRETGSDSCVLIHCLTHCRYLSLYLPVSPYLRLVTLTSLSVPDYSVLCNVNVL
jgi:hypothetical protein